MSLLLLPTPTLSLPLALNLILILVLHLKDLRRDCRQVWDSTTLQCKRTLEGHEDNVRVLTVGSRHVFSGSWDKTIRVWDIDTLECIKARHPHKSWLACSAAASPSVSSVVTCF